MIILGLNHGEINSSATIVKDGKVIFAAPQERFNRQKKTKDFPKEAVEFCLSELGITMSDVDAIAQAWNPGAGWNKYKPLISGTRIRREDYYYALPDCLYQIADRKLPKWTKHEMGNDSLPPIYYVQHHLTHAANGFYLSEFEDAAILTVDWRGESECMTMSHGKGKKIDTFQTQEIPHSLGMFYAAFTALLGYRPDSDEWKVMALAAMDVDYQDYLEKIRLTVRLLDTGGFELDETYYQGGIPDTSKIYTQKFIDLFGSREGYNGEEASEWHYKVSKAMQQVSEEITWHMLKHLHSITGSDNVVVSGGFFMNSVCNGKILDNSPFKNLYISHSPADVGNCFGAALFVAHDILDEDRYFGFNTSYLGPQYSSDEIEAILTKRCIPHSKMDNPAETIAKLLSEGEIVAHFDGRMEFGERALGNRSILGNPCDPDVKDKINSMIKYRESYRPFAPATPYETSHEYFEVEENYECYFMEKVVPVRESHRKNLPAITHFDGSGRIQTVKKEHNERFHSIISEFGKITNYPVVVNTSFNVNGEPVVMAPEHALGTFYNSGLKYLVLGDFLIQK